MYYYSWVPPIPLGPGRRPSLAPRESLKSWGKLINCPSPRALARWGGSLHYLLLSMLNIILGSLLFPCFRGGPPPLGKKVYPPSQGEGGSLMCQLGGVGGIGYTISPRPLGPLGGGYRGGGCPTDTFIEVFKEFPLGPILFPCFRAGGPPLVKAKAIWVRDIIKKKEGGAPPSLGEARRGRGSPSRLIYKIK
jgi:hypothetical protein